MIHSELKEALSPELMKKVRRISDCIDIAFKDKGVESLYTWATTEDEEKYNQFLGYTPTGAVLEVANYDKPVIEFKKDL